MRSAARAPIVLAALASAAAVLAGCGGGSDGPGVLFEPADGNEIARRAMLIPDDLPGDGWETIIEDQFSDEPIEADTRACRDINTSREALRAAIGDRRTGRASTELGRPGASLPVSVASEVAIYDDTDAPAVALRTRKSELDGSFDRCMRDSVEADLKATTGANVTTVNAQLSAEVPPDGVGKAFDLKVATTGEPATLRVEVYTWRVGNAGVTVTVLGDARDVTPVLVEAAVSSMREEMDEIAR